MAFLGIDVGTQGARAGLFDRDGMLLGTGAAAFPLHRTQGAFAEYVSTDIWKAVADAVKAALPAAGVGPAEVDGIGIDAACSLVVDLPDGFSVSVNVDNVRDCIAWLDHRAIAETEEINRTGSRVLDSVGGRMSVEMQLPKLLWLSRHAPDAFAAARGFYDLCDWLTYRATGSRARSVCTAVCKWTYLADHAGWDTTFFHSIGLSVLLEDDAARIGSVIVQPGQSVGLLTPQAAADLGLEPGIPVGAGLIDAYAGALGSLGVSDNTASDARLALIAGTSACHVVSTPIEQPVPGVWGPYHHALIDGYWALEAGQSACGDLLDTMVSRHAAFEELGQSADRAGRGIYDHLNYLVAQYAAGAPPSHLTARRHVLPDINGNRAPLADPQRKGAVSGLDANIGLRDLVLDYLAAIQALACGTRHILDAMGESQVRPKAIVVSGSLKSNDLFLQETANFTRLRVVVPDAAEPVLLGAAMLGAIASGSFQDRSAAMARMSPAMRADYLPDEAVTHFCDRKYRVFRKMLDDQQAYDRIMTDRGAA